MIVDARLEFAANLNLAVGSLFGGLVALSDVIDIGVAQGIGLNNQGGGNSSPRGPMIVRMVALTAAVGAGGGGSGSMQPTLVTSDTLDALGAGSGLLGGTTAWTGFPYVASQFRAGRLLAELVLPPKKELGRYIQLIWIPAGGGFTSGRVSCYMVADGSNPDIYPNAVP